MGNGLHLVPTDHILEVRTEGALIDLPELFPAESGILLAYVLDELKHEGLFRKLALHEIAVLVIGLLRMVEQPAYALLVPSLALLRGQPIYRLGPSFFLI